MPTGRPTAASFPATTSKTSLRRQTLHALARSAVDAHATMGPWPTSSSSTAAAAAAWNGSAPSSWTAPRPARTGCPAPAAGRLGRRRSAGRRRLGRGDRPGWPVRVAGLTWSAGRPPAASSAVPRARPDVGVARPGGAGRRRGPRPPARGALAVRVHGRRVARLRPGRRPRRPRGRVAARGGVGAAQRRAVRPRGRAGPLARRGRPRFARRERRRGNRYDGVVLDPPSYGHGTGAWQIEEHLGPLLADLAALVGPRPAFVLLSAHTQGYDGDRLGALVREHFGVAATGEPMMVVSRAGSRCRSGRGPTARSAEPARRCRRSPTPSRVITSPKNPRVRAAADLRDRRARDAAGLTLVDGPASWHGRWPAGARVVEVFVDDASGSPARRRGRRRAGPGGRRRR